MREQSREHAGGFFIGASGGRNRCCSGVVVAAGVCMRSQLDTEDDDTVDPAQACCVEDSREEAMASLKNLASKTSASRCVARMRLIVSATNSLRNSGVHTVNAIG